MKGFVTDVLTALVYMLFLAIFFIAMAYAANAMAGSSGAMSQYFGFATSGYRAFDSLAVLFVIGWGLALMLSAAFIKSNPVFYFAFFIVQLVILFIAPMLSNAYDTGILNAPQLGAEASAHFQSWTLVFQLYPLVSLFLSVIFAIAIYVYGG
jgi:uncharacterized membrane protein YciS (DUF1049 family)